MPLKKTANKNVTSEKTVKGSNTAVKNAKSVTGPNAAMKMTVTSTPTMSSRLHHRKALRLAGKRPGVHHHHGVHRTPLNLVGGKGRSSAMMIRNSSIDSNPCDNSDDSGLGVHLRFDNHMDILPLNYERSMWVDDLPDIKRRKLDLKVENDETNDGYCFPDNLKNCKENNAVIRTPPCTPIQNLSRNVAQNNNGNKNISRCFPQSVRRPLITGPITLTSQLSTTSRNGKVQLQIMCQPEQQHRARYQTEGSRGAVKDRTGNGFPIVKLLGYSKPATLQIFIGTDLGRVAPHMFYQACRVCGKNSTPCMEKKIDGTIVIEVELEPSKDMIATCDCVGILKERNVDVEHRFPEQLSPRSKKKSTKCRMVFRTMITNDDGTTETLQVCSQPIVCTQPPGIPEICKKSLTTCTAAGGLELFILGKNFLKDTKVVFQQHSSYDSQVERSEVVWEETVSPDKEYLQQTHLVCVVPPYLRQDIQEGVPVRLFVNSSGKNSEAHSFMYTPIVTPVGSPSVSPTTPVGASPPQVTVTGSPVTANGPTFLSKMLWQTSPPKQELDLGMMPPPATLVPMAQRRPSTNVPLEAPTMRCLKTELLDESSNSQGSPIEHHMLNENGIEMQRQRFRVISESTMDSHQDDSMMSHIESINENSNSVHSFHCDSSNHSIHGEESNSVSIPPPSTTSISILQHLEPPVNPLNSLSSLNPALKGIDLRMKASLATALNDLANTQSLNDLANTQSPSLATLHRFVVTEPTNMPLPTQTGQSVENFLTTLENNNNKPIVSVTLANSMKTVSDVMLNTTLSDAGPILSSQFAPAISNVNLNGLNSLNTLNHQSVASMTETLLSQPPLTESHNLTTSGLFPVTSSLIPTAQVSSEVLKQQENNLIIAQHLLQTTATPKLDELVNSTVQSHIGSPIINMKNVVQVQDIRRSPLLAANPSEIFLPRNPSSEVIPNTNEIIIHSPHQNEVMMSSQVSPVICNSQPLMQTICQPEILKNSPVSVESIVLDAAVDYLETQKKLNEISRMDNHLLVSQQKTEEQSLINSLLVRTTSPQEPLLTNQVLLQNQAVTDLLKLSQNQFVNTNSQLLTAAMTTDLKPIVEVKQQDLPKTLPDSVRPPGEIKKSEENMIPQALTNMSENDLISYINPSCFDQV